MFGKKRFTFKVVIFHQNFKWSKRGHFYHFWPKKLSLEISLKFYVMLGQYMLTKKKVVNIWKNVPRYLEYLIHLFLRIPYKDYFEVLYNDITLWLNKDDNIELILALKWGILLQTRTKTANILLGFFPRFCFLIFYNDKALCEQSWQ